MNLRELKEVFRMVEKTDFTEVEIVQGDMRVRIERGKGQPVVYSQPPIFSSEPRTTSTASLETSEAARASVAPKEKDEPKELPGAYVTSPFVGTFYRSPSPDTDSYVEIGQVVKKGQVLCIVEAMKLMNEIESELDGKVADILAQNAKPVEFGEKLFRIEPL